MNLDPLQVVECVGSQVALAAVGTDEDGHVLNDEECRSSPITACDVTQPNSRLSASRALFGVKRHYVTLH